VPASLPPGPRLPKLAQSVGYAYAFPRLAESNRRRYGDTWELRLPGFPPAVVTSNRDAIRRIFTGDPLVRRHANDVLLPLVGPQSLMLLEPADHLDRRKLELPPFHGERIRALASVVDELVHAEIDRWRPGETIAVHQRARLLTLDVILKLVLGVRDAELRSRLARIFQAMNTPFTTLGMFLPPELARRSWWNLWARPYWWMRDRLDALLLEQIGRTRSDPLLEERDDVLAMLVLARDGEGRGLDNGQLRDDLATLVTAGHETTATAIAWAADLLVHNPGVATQLREAEEDGGRELIKAAAKEVLRVRTVVPVSAARVLLEPFPLGEHEAPPGTVLLVNAWDVHRDPSLHPDPEAFRPERFVDDPPDGYSFLPFGGGAHRCLGASLASMELELALEAIVSRCELAPVGRPARPARRSVTLIPAGGAKVKVAAVRPRREAPAAVTA
jgi:cytochrome P450 family 135